MKLSKFRDWVVEVKLSFMRTTSYLNIFNFLMITLIFMNTTLWEYDFMQNLFQDRKTFLLIGLISVLVLTAAIGYFDTKLRLWRTEVAKSLYPERNPMFLPEAFQCAKMLSDLKKQGTDTKELEAHLDSVFAQSNLKKEFDFFKEKTK